MKSYNEIIESILRKDENSLEYLYETYGKSFYSYSIQRWNLSEDDAWEVVYSTLEKLIISVSNYQFKSKSDFDRFIFKVLINFLRQQYRSKKSYHNNNNIVYTDFITKNELNTEVKRNFSSYQIDEATDAQVIESANLKLLINTLKLLDEVDRDLLLLRAQDYSYDEIAKLLNIESANLKVRHHRAKKKLISMLSQTPKF